MFKRKLALLLVVLLVLAAFSGCTQEPTATGESNENSSGTSESASSDEVVTIETSFSVDELTDELIASFEAEHSNIKVSRVTLNSTKLMAMVAAGSAPDVWRVDANQIPNFATLGLMLDLTEYINDSSVFDRNDFADCWGLFQYDGSEFGKGAQYGIPHSWGMDHMLWVNKAIFEEKGLTVPSPENPITYDELFNLAKGAMTKDSNETVTTYGLVTWLDMYKASAIMMKKMGESFWKENFRKSNFNSASGIEVLTYWTNFAKAYACQSTLNPVPSGWGGPDYLEGKAAIFCGNYGFNSFVSSNESSKTHLEDFVLLPAPIIEGKPRVTWVVYGAMGGVINKDSKNPDAAFTFLEWYLAGKRAEDRTAAAWGLPPYKSMMSLLPVNTDFGQACLAVNNDEMKYFDARLEVNPFISDDSVSSVVKQYTDEVLYGKMTVEEACAKIDADLAVLIAEGMEIAGIK